jgi:hypothetical protein
MREVNFGGVFVPAELLWAAAAFVVSSLLTRALSRTRFYALVWHRALFDVCLFVLVWGAISAIAYHVAFSSAWPIDR